MLKNLSKQYFELFEHKNTDQISEMFSEEVILKDWNSSCSGKVEVKRAIQNIFDSVESINVEIINIYCEKLVVISELKIITNNTSELVVDIIVFDKSNKIVSICAYKC